jgi:hypothetical protein
MARSMLYYLIGYPGVGKHTIREAMLAQAGGLHERLVLVDNHYVNNPIFGLLDVDGIKPVPPEVWIQVRKVSDAVATTIRELSPPHWSFIKTNYLADRPDERAGFDAVAELARARNAAFLPVMLRCRPEEHRQRLGDPARAERLKWRDQDGLGRLIQEKGHLEPDHPNLMDLDATDLSPDEVAKLILGRGRLLMADTN